MESVVLVIHLFLALAIIGLVLLQRSEGGGLVGTSGGMGALASARGTANGLTRATAICAAGFFTTSLILGIMAGAHSKDRSLLNKLDTVPAAATAPAVPGDSKADAKAAKKDSAKKTTDEKPAKKTPTAPVAQ